MTAWVVVTNGTRCRIFEREGGGDALHEKEDWVHPASRLAGGEMVSDRPGSDGGGPGQGRHPMPSKTDPKVHEQEVFAHDICKRLDESRGRNAYDRLYLIAPPSFLGKVRKAMNDQVRKLVAGELDRDLTRQSPAEIQQYLARAR